MCTVTISYDPYTIEELKAGIAESERQLEHGEFFTGAELDIEVNKLIASWH